MPMSSIDICSRALVKIGANAISSFEEGTTEAHVAASLYNVVLDGLLSSYPWNFAIVQRRLAQLATPPVADFQNAYALPPECLRVVSAGSGARGHGLRYRIRESALHADSDSVVLTFVKRPSTNNFPPYFSLALVAKLAAEFCIPLTDSTSRWKDLSDAAERELQIAKLSDAVEESAPSLEDFTLVEGRN